MIGKEIADAIAPIVMWAAIVGGVGIAIYFAVKKWNAGVVARDDLDEIADAKEEQDEARGQIRKTIDHLLDLFKRNRV